MYCRFRLMESFYSQNLILGLAIRCKKERHEKLLFDGILKYLTMEKLLDIREILQNQYFPQLCIIISKKEYLEF